MNRSEFDFALAGARMSHADAADLLGITGEELEAKMSGNAAFTSDEITELACRLGLTVEGIDTIFFDAEDDWDDI